MRSAESLVRCSLAGTLGVLACGCAALTGPNAAAADGVHSAGEAGGAGNGEAASTGRSDAAVDAGANPVLNSRQRARPHRSTAEPEVEVPVDAAAQRAFDAARRALRARPHRRSRARISRR